MCIGGGECYTQNRYGIKSAWRIKSCTSCFMNFQMDKARGDCQNDNLHVLLIFLYILSFCGGHMAQLEQHRPQSRDTARKKTALCMGSTGFPSQAHKTIAGTNASPVFSRTCTRLGFFPPFLADFSKCHAQCFFYCRSLFSFGVSLSRRTSFTKCQCCLHCRLTP